MDVDSWSICCSCTSDLSYLSNDLLAGSESEQLQETTKERDALKAQLKKAKREIEELRDQKEELRDILGGTQTSLLRVYEGSQGGSHDTSTDNYFLSFLLPDKALALPYSSNSCVNGMYGMHTADKEAVVKRRGNDVFDHAFGWTV
jgi:hypothetical protein